MFHLDFRWRKLIAGFGYLAHHMLVRCRLQRLMAYTISLICRRVSIELIVGLKVFISNGKFGQEFHYTNVVLNKQVV